MTIEHACEILNDRQHRGYCGWKPSDVLPYGAPAPYPESTLNHPRLMEGEIIAIAESYEHERLRELIRQLREVVGSLAS